MFLIQETEEKSGVEMDLDKIKELIATVEESSIAEITIEEGDTRITVRKSGERRKPARRPSVRRAARRPRPKPRAEDEKPDNYHVVKSPMVGTFYRAASPTSDPVRRGG